MFYPTELLCCLSAKFSASIDSVAERLTVEFQKARNVYRFILFEKRYMLIFQIVDHTVYADYVVDCRQDYGWLLR